MILTETVQVRWHYSNKDYYQSLKDESGNQKYFFTKEKDVFTIPFEDISEKSSSKIHIKCDYCGIEEERIYRNWRIHFDISPIKKDACVKCKGKKTAESNNLTYGTSNVMQIKEIQEKVESTNLERYGVKNAGGSKQSQDKLKKHNMENYGVEYYFQTDNFKEQYVDSMQAKYGVDNAFQSPEVQEKMRKTLMLNYGVEYSMQSPEIREKAVKSMYERGTTPTSRPQIYLHNLYGGELNYPAGRYNLDIALIDEKTAIEFDGGAHDLKVILGGITKEDFKRREIIRGVYLKKDKWNVITIQSKTDALPDKETLLEFISFSRNIFSKGRSWVTFNIDDQTVKYRDHIEHFPMNNIVDFRVIRRINNL